MAEGLSRGVDRGAEEVYNGSMFKFIHCADIHLGSAMSANLPPERREERRRELRATFSRLADGAEAAGCAAVLLCGDVFDSDAPFKKDKEYFYNVIKSHPAVDFLYLRGNHDCGESYCESLANLKTFGPRWTYFDYGPVTIAGAEAGEANARSLPSSLALDGSRINIVMLHGQIGGGIDLSAYRGRGIDYLALGHVHAHSRGRLDDRGMYAYSGCLEARGFDEPGSKGYILVEADRGLRASFVPFASRTVLDISSDLSSCPDIFAALGAVRAVCPRSPKDMLRLTLTGRVSFDPSSLAADVKKELEGRYYALSVVDNVRPDIAAVSCGGDALRAAFARAVAEAEGYSEEDRQLILSLGLKALDGRTEEL